MRSGSGKIYNKGSIKPQSSCLSEITNKPFIKSQVGSEKGQRITQLDSCSSKSNSRIQNLQHLCQHSANDDIKHSDVHDDPVGIVRKLSSLNTIFKELKMLKEREESYEIVLSISRIQDKFIGLERQILKAAHFQHQN